MSESRQITVSKTEVSKLAILALAIVFVAGLLEIMNYFAELSEGIFGRLADSKILDPIKLEILKIGEENIHQSKPSQKKSLKILVADDEMDILTLYKTFLEAKGKEITTVTDGHKCVEMYKRKNKLYVSGNYFDIVILDQKMPIMTGLEAAVKIFRDKSSTENYFCIRIS